MQNTDENIVVDRGMINLIKDESTLASKPIVILENTPDEVLIFKRGELLFVFNFNPSTSFTDYGFEIDVGSYTTMLNTDNEFFGGTARNDDTQIHLTQYENGSNWMKLYLPSRTGMVLKIID